MNDGLKDNGREWLARQSRFRRAPLRPPLSELDNEHLLCDASEHGTSDASASLSTAASSGGPGTCARSGSTSSSRRSSGGQSFPAEIDIDAEPRHAAFHGRKFRFTNTFGPDADTLAIFAEQKDAVLGVLKGFDATVMCYGSTGAGKTHTMVGTAESPGVMPLALDALFERIAAGASSASSPPASGSFSYALQVSALELLEERCVDLLHNRAAVVLRAGSSAKGGGGGGGGLVFSGLKEVAVSTKAQLLACIQSAMSARTTAANYRHEHSSRSHFVVRLRVDAARLVTLGEPTSPNSADADALDAGAADAEKENDESAARAAHNASGVCVRDATSAVLTLVDLAGSEAATQNASATAVAQGVTINKSLHWLKVAVHDSRRGARRRCSATRP